MIFLVICSDKPELRGYRVSSTSAGSKHEINIFKS